MSAPERNSAILFACATTWLATFVLVGTVIVAVAVSAQENEAVRDLKPSAWYSTRPRDESKTKPARVLYRRKSGVVKPGNEEAGSEIGVTIWRLRPSVKSDEKAIRELVHSESGKNQEWTPERIGTMTPLEDGDRVRVSIQSLRPGYLYVINQAVYADGNRGPANLIFPTRRIRGGDHRIRPGYAIEIPSPTDSPRFFRLQRSLSDAGAVEVGEELLVVIVPRPLEGLDIGTDVQKLTAAQVGALTRDLTAEPELWELEGGRSKPYTKQEQQAAEATRALSTNDPYPQTIYRGIGKPGQPMVLRLKLQISK